MKWELFAKDCKLYEHVYITCPELGKPMESESKVRGWGRGRERLTATQVNVFTLTWTSHKANRNQSIPDAPDMYSLRCQLKL